MPERIENDTKTTEIEHEYLQRGGGWRPFAGNFGQWRRDDFPRAWKRNRARILTECREKRGLFRRPFAFWELEATGREGTEPAYLLDHPELQTHEEKEWLKAHSIPRWLLNPRSEWYSPEEYLQGQGLRFGLDDSELADLKEFIEIRDKNIGIQ